MNTKNSLRLVPCVYALAVSLLVCTANAGEVWVKKILNTTESINAMLAASNIGIPVVIKLVPGTYKSQQSFTWEDGYYGSTMYPARCVSTIPRSGAMSCEATERDWLS